MRQEKILITLIGKLSQELIDPILEIQKKEKCSIQIEKSIDTFETSKKIGDKILNKEIDRAIIIDSFGSLPFMVIGKMPKTVVAQISDEHSAHMTSEHNGSNVLVIGSHLTGPETILQIVKKYISTPFAGGRHIVRTDMLSKMIKIKESI